MKRLGILFLILACPAMATAHAVDYRVEETRATTLVLNYIGGRAFAFESYEIFGPGDETPFQTGRTDRFGRLSFLPDRPGDWSIKAVSNDGHGVRAVVPVSDDLSARAERAKTRPGRTTGIALGLLLIAVITVWVSLQYSRRRS